VRTNTPIASTRNDRIVLVRLLCIFGMIYVHVPFMESASLSGVGLFGDLSNFTVFELLRSLLVDGYGRTSACLLSIVSGFLVAKTLNVDKPRYWPFFKRRFSSIYVPMVVWGFVTVMVFSFVSMVQTTFLSDACGGRSVWSIDCLNVVLHFSAISTGPTMHLAFLRDLFVCMLLAPILIVVMRHIPLIGLSALTSVYLLDWESMLVLRPLVILGFSVGLTIGLRQINFAWVDRFWLCWLLFAVLFALLTTAFNVGQLPKLQWLFAVNGLDARETLLYPLTRLFGALAIWSLSLKLVSSPIMNWSVKLEPYLFIAFCSHPLLLSMLQEVSGLIITNPAVTVLYPVWFVLAPAVAIVASVLGMRLGGLLLPNLLQNFVCQTFVYKFLFKFVYMISGGRILPDPKAALQVRSSETSSELASTRSV